MASEEIAERIEMAATKPSASTESESRGERAEQGDIAQDESSSRTSVPTGGAESPMTARKVLRIEDGTYDATDSFWIKVSHTTNVKQIPKKAAIVDVVAEQLAVERGGIDAALLYVLKEYFPEFRVRIYADALLQAGASPSASDTGFNTTLHIACERKHKSVVQLLLEHGALYLARNQLEQKPFEIAMANKSDEIAAMLVKVMPKSAVRDLFTGFEDQSSRQSFHALIDDPEKMQDTIMAVLDCMIEPIEERPGWFRLYYQILDGDSAGRSPKDDRFCKDNQSCLQIIARSNNKEAVYHDVVRLMLKRKWKEFAGNIYKLRTLMFFLNLVAMTLAFVVAGSVDDPLVYDSALDYVRGVCEVVVAINTVFSLVSEVNQMRKHRLRYLHDQYNYLDMSSILLLFTVIPLRATGSNAQWTIASLAYFSTVLISFKYASAYRSIGQYTQIVGRIVQYDMVRFSVLFLVFLFAFSGSLFLALRGERVSMTSNGTTSNLNLFRETSTYGHILLTGLRILIEQDSIVDFYGEKPEFSWLGVLLMLFFMFTIIVLLLNLLIAQLSDTYQNVQSDAQRELELNRAANVARIEKNSLIFRDLRTKYYREVEDIEDPKGVLERWEVPPISNISRKLNRLEEKLYDQEVTLKQMKSQLSKITSLLQLQLQRDASEAPDGEEDEEDEIDV
ncbi:transient receptor potential cation channel subfamily V member 1-like [Oscarella lobularis]|uniref:transient receptor potential cation channel subfamily V member 1-like n=1 Tax=Oscarella lobularis TaxID=121494 RepID=UPI003314427B